MNLVNFVIVVSHYVYCLFIYVYNMVLIVPPMIDCLHFLITTIEDHHASKCKVLPGRGCGNTHRVEEIDEHETLDGPPRNAFCLRERGT